MVFVKKMKPDRSITGLLPAFFTLAGCAVVAVIFGRQGLGPFATVAFGCFAGFAFVAWRRTGSIGYLGSTVYLAFGSLAFASAKNSIFGFRTREVYQAFELLSLPIIAWLIYLMVTKRVKWRGREIMELAAAPVDDVADGFTERPRPLGKAEYTTTELRNFVDFCRRQLIALPHPETDRVYLAPVRMGKEFVHLFSTSRDYHKDTWVCFDHDGNVTVNISREDYLEYQEDFSFDQLCASLGSVFIEFLELHRNGREVRIMDRLNAVGTGIFS